MAAAADVETALRQVKTSIDMIRRLRKAWKAEEANPRSSLQTRSFAKAQFKGAEDEFGWQWENVDLILEGEKTVSELQRTLGTIEAAERLGKTPERVRQLIATGKLRAERSGRDHRILPEALEEYLRVHGPRVGPGSRTRLCDCTAICQGRRYGILCRKEEAGLTTT